MSSGLAHVCRLLNTEDARYIVVGAVAMQLWGTTRATRDIDILIDPTIGNAQRVLRALAALPLEAAAAHTPAEVVSRVATKLDDEPMVDILTRAWNLRWTEAEKEVAVFTVDGVPVPTVSLANLMASKRTGRLQDLADLEVLEEVERLRRRV